MSVEKTILALAAVSVLGGCATRPDTGDQPTATARLRPTQGNTASGTVRFVQWGDRVVVNAEVSGLKPDSAHGFHPRGRGDCSAPDAASAGEHWNPFGRAHGDPRSGTHHAGDMLNIRADPSGNSSYLSELRIGTVTAGPVSIVGRSVVVHAQPDDYRSQPAGNTGARIACGVIE